MDLKPYIQKIQGRDYLTVAGRVKWFRSDFPITGDAVGSIETELVSDNPITFKAYIIVNGSIVATAYASDNGGRGKQAKGRVLEVIETSAVGRALARAGYGEEDSEEDYLSDAPIERKLAPQAQAQAQGETRQHVLKNITKGSKGEKEWMIANAENGDRANFWSWSETFGLAGYDASVDFNHTDDNELTPINPITVTFQRDGKGYWTISEIEPKGVANEAETA